MNVQREQWQSPVGFVLATIGAAVGLGNIWRFSYVAGENGGGAFLVVYLLGVLLVGLPIVIAELALGRRAQGDAVSAFADIAPRSAWVIPGWLGIVVSFVILGYYSVVAGWALKYFSGAVLGNLWPAAAQGYGIYFQSFIADAVEPIVWQFAMLAVSVFIVTGGIRRGIEIANRILMPVIGILVVGLAIYGLSLPGSEAGWRFLLVPDWQALTQPKIFLAALGQGFFSLGAGMAIFITYGSYVARNISIPMAAGAIVIGDTLFAIVAGLAIFPAMFAFGVDPTSGPELAFITLPQIFLAMPGGKTVGTIFFLLLVCAALTSMVSLLEVPATLMINRLGMRRRPAVVLVGSVAFLIGIPAALSFGLLSDMTVNGLRLFDAMDYTVSNLLLPLGGILIALFVGWRWGRQPALAESDLGASRLGTLWLWTLRVVTPTIILLMIATATGGE